MTPTHRSSPHSKAVLLPLMLACAVALTGACSRAAEPPRPEPAPERCGGFFKPLCGEIESMIKGEPDLGVSLSSIDDAGQVSVATFHNAPGGEPIAPEMRFELGSITKTFTGARIMQLVKEGRISLDATIESLVPADEVTYNANLPGTLTVRQLLNFTAGLEDYTLGYAVIASDLNAFWPMKNMVTPPFFKNPPVTGTACYTSTNTMLLGMAIDRQAGGNGSTKEPLIRSFHDHLFKPAGLTHTSLGGYEPIYPIDSCTNVNFDGDVPPNSCSTRGLRRYTGSGTSKTDSQSAYLSFAGPAGVLVSTASDTAQFYRWLFTSGPGAEMISAPVLIGERAITDPSFIKWFKCGAPSAPWDFPYPELVKLENGYNVQIMTVQYGDKRTPVYAFLGGTLSFNGLAFYMPEYKRSAAVLVNNFNSPSAQSDLFSTATVYDIAYRLMRYTATGR